MQIPRSKLEALFAQMRNDGQDPQAPLLWGYFFFGPDRWSLESLANDPALDDYRRVHIGECDDGSEWVLHVERIERHYAESLASRNKLFKALANRFSRPTDTTAWTLAPSRHYRQYANSER